MLPHQQVINGDNDYYFLVKYTFMSYTYTSQPIQARQLLGELRQAFRQFTLVKTTNYFFTFCSCHQSQDFSGPVRDRVGDFCILKEN